MSVEQVAVFILEHHGVGGFNEDDVPPVFDLAANRSVFVSARSRATSSIPVEYAARPDGAVLSGMVTWTPAASSVSRRPCRPSGRVVRVRIGEQQDCGRLGPRDSRDTPCIEPVLECLPGRGGELELRRDAEQFAPRPARPECPSPSSKWCQRRSEFEAVSMFADGRSRRLPRPLRDAGVQLGLERHIDAGRAVALAALAADTEVEHFLLEAVGVKLVFV